LLARESEFRFEFLR
jgi:Glycine zipper